MTIVPLFSYTNPGFHKHSFPTLVSKILLCDTWYSYTPLQYHVLYTLSERGVTVLEYVARFTELACFGDDYVATDVTKVRKFEDGLKLSIRGKIVGHGLQDMDSMVSTTLIIEREVDDARSIRDAGASNKKRGSQASSSGSGKKQRTFVPRGF